MLMFPQYLGLDGSPWDQFSPLSLTPKVWYRADQGITESSGAVSQWNDLSVNGHHLPQGTGANQPIWGATSGPNGTPAVTFDGSNDYLSTTFTNVAQPYHAFVVMKTLAIATGNQGYFTGAGSNERILYGRTSNTVSSFMNSGSVILDFTHSDTSNFYLWEVKADTPNCSIVRGNGTPVTGNPGTQGLSAINMGRLVGFGQTNVAIAEAFVKAGSLVTGGDATALRAYFAARYGVATQ